MPRHAARGATSTLLVAASSSCSTQAVSSCSGSSSRRLSKYRRSAKSCGSGLNCSLDPVDLSRTADSDGRQKVYGQGCPLFGPLRCMMRQPGYARRAKQSGYKYSPGLVYGSQLEPNVPRPGLRSLWYNPTYTSRDLLLFYLRGNKRGTELSGNCPGAQAHVGPITITCIAR